MYPDTQQQYQNNNRRAYIVIGVVAAIILLFVGHMIITQISRQGTVAVEVEVLPTGAQLEANGKKISGSTAYLKPGMYTITGSKEGFEDQEDKVTIDETNRTIMMTLPAVSAAAKEYVQKNQDAYLRLEAKTGELARARGIAFQDRNPIVKLLPEQNVIYKIGYISQNNKDITLTIHAFTPDQRKAALQKIRDWGYDPTDYKIVFTDFINPFGEAHEEEE